MKSEAKGWIIFVIIFLLLVMMNGCESDVDNYETAGKTFGTWIKTDPRSWTDTQTDYYNNLMDWANRN